MQSVFYLIVMVLSSVHAVRYEECGLYGFTCVDKSKLRLCDNSLFYGPTFVCPKGTVCNDSSRKVCEDSSTYVNPSLLKNGRLECKRNQRLPDASVNGCKGYILCVQNKLLQFEVVKFRCTGNTLFNPNTRACSSPLRYKCPESSVVPALFADDRISSHKNDQIYNRQTSIDCKHYRFRVDQSSESNNKAAFFCPQRHPLVSLTLKCTIFSNNFCVQLEKEDEEVTYKMSKRKPRFLNKGEK